jgi:hypothetical protein
MKYHDSILISCGIIKRAIDIRWVCSNIIIWWLTQLK